MSDHHKARIGMSVAFHQGGGGNVMAAIVTGPNYMGESGQQYINLIVFPEGGEPFHISVIGPAEGPYGTGWKLP